MKDILLLNLRTINVLAFLLHSFERIPQKMFYNILIQGWGQQINGLTGTNVPNDEENVFWSGGGDNESNGGIEDCDFDNQGVGRSSMPINESDHQGPMIVCKIAATVPDRVLSLALLNAMGGGFQCFPEIFKEY